MSRLKISMSDSDGRMTFSVASPGPKILVAYPGSIDETWREIHIYEDAKWYTTRPYQSSFRPTDAKLPDGAGQPGAAPSPRLRILRESALRAFPTFLAARFSSPRS